MVSMNRVSQETYDALVAIAEGYKVSTSNDRWIVVENPRYRPDDGSSPNLVIDVKSFVVYKYTLAGTFYFDSKDPFSSPDDEKDYD